VTATCAAMPRASPGCISATKRGLAPSVKLNGSGISEEGRTGYASTLSDTREPDPQFDANVQDNDCAQRRQDNASRMKPFAARRREQMRYSPAKEAADDTEHNGPEEEHVHVQH